MSMKCSKCKSAKIIKKGFKHNKSVKKQRYQCKKCNRCFIKNDGFKRMRHKPEDIVRAVHQHIDGMSLSKTQNHLFQHDNVKVSRQTINEWTKKYSIFLKSCKLGSKARYQRKNSLR